MIRGQPRAPPMRPLPENYHTAVWTGSEMIVWGGVNISGYLNTGGRYDPGTNSWTATSTTNAPAAPRRSHGSVDRQRNDRLGRERPRPHVEHRRQIQSRHRQLDSHQHHQRAHCPRNHTAVWTGSEMIVWGGSDGFDYLNTGGRYNPSTDSWTATARRSALADKITRPYGPAAK